MVLPPDARQRHFSANGISAEQRFRTALGERCRVIVHEPATIADGIDVSRSVFSQCVFDEEKTTQGIFVLRHHRFEVDEETKQFSRTPRHDQYSHGASAWRSFGLSAKMVNTARAEVSLSPVLARPKVERHGWLNR